MLTIEIAKKLLDTTERCNKTLSGDDNPCLGCPYENAYRGTKVIYPCMDEKAEDLIKFLKEWIENESNRLD